ncbi:uncharacterized protein LOC142340155 [Convolutriloba macropyga]|uniref:uncharacterized protein LOC142340155 n=1 Tax=Convolutriloba macropyga TaxID=536237 RepID=UPI003F526B25
MYSNNSGNFELSESVVGAEGGSGSSRPLSISTARRRSSGVLPSDVFQYDLKHIDKQRGSVAVCPRYYSTDGYYTSSGGGFASGHFGFGASGMSGSVRGAHGGGGGGAASFSRSGGAEPYRDARCDSQIIFEWRLLANVQNRVNTLLFVFILAIILMLYYIYHAPPPLSNNIKE